MINEPKPAPDQTAAKAEDMARTFELYAKVLRKFPELVLRFGHEDFWEVMEQGGNLLDGTTAVEIELELNELDEPEDD